MSADEKLRKAANLTGPGAGLAEAMGAPWQPSAQSPDVSVAIDVLARRTAELSKLGEDIDPRAVGVGLDAADKVIGALSREVQGSPSIALIVSGFFTDVDGREHNHMLAPLKYSPPRGWDCCADLPGQRPTSWHADDISDLLTEAIAEEQSQADEAFRQSVKGDPGQPGSRGDTGERGLYGPPGRDGRNGIDGRDAPYVKHAAFMRGEGNRMVAVIETLNDGSQRRFSVLRGADGRPVELVLDDLEQGGQP